nr:hypothetical protein [Mycobacterium tuberculosis]
MHLNEPAADRASASITHSPSRTAAAPAGAAGSATLATAGPAGPAATRVCSSAPAGRRHRRAGGLLFGSGGAGGSGGFSNSGNGGAGGAGGDAGLLVGSGGAATVTRLRPTTALSCPTRHDAPPA